MKKRYHVLAALFLLSVITYLDRVCISLAGPRMKSELGLTNEQFGWVLSAFAIGYSLFEIPSGAWGDRHGARRVLTRIVVWWSVFTTLTGSVWNFISLLATRFLFGAGEAGAYPNASIALSRWFPLAERGRAQGVIWTASRLGAALAPLAVTPIMLTFGWRAVFHVFGAVGLVWAVVWYVWYRDEPRAMKGISNEEVEEIETRRHLQNVHQSLPWRQVIGNANFWALMIAYHLNIWGAYFYVSWLPTYLQEGRGFTEKDMVIFGTMPFALGMVGNLFGGYATDILSKRIGLRWGRSMVAALGLATSGIIILASAATQDKIVAVVLLSLGYMFKDVALPVTWAASMDLGQSHSGAVSGALNTAGQLGASIVSVVVGYLIGWGGYNAPLVVIGSLLLVASALWLRVDVTKPLFADNSEEKRHDPV